MENYKECLEQQLKEIDDLISKSNKALSKMKDVEDYRLSIAKSNGYHQYYWIDKDTKKRSYAKVSEMEIIKKVAQRDYEMEINKKLRSFRVKLYRFLAQYDIAEIDKVYTELAEARKVLVVPIIEPDQVYAENWKNVSYVPMGFDGTAAEFYSNNGIRVRSKSELMIANALEMFKIPYRYEYPLNLKGFGNIRPDFICLNVRTRTEYVWEHFGIMDSVSYANKNVAKIHAYEQNGYFPGKNMIMTFETSQHAISSNIIKVMIEKYLI